MDIKNFPFLTKTFECKGSQYYDGMSGEDRILVSNKLNQWILTINSEYFVVAMGETVPNDIINALELIKNGKKVTPNEMAMTLRKITKSVGN